MHKGSAFLLIMFAVQMHALSQQNEYMLTGRILDSKSLDPVSQVIIKSNHQASISDNKGAFEIRVGVGDSVVISHIGFKTLYWKVGEDGKAAVDILLEEEVIELSEVLVNAFIPEEVFKSEILHATPPLDYEYEVAFRNLQFIRQVYQFGYFYDYSSYDTFLKNTKNMGEISFFSNNSSLGIWGAIRRIGLSRKYKDFSFIQPFSQGAHTPTRDEKAISH